MKSERVCQLNKQFEINNQNWLEDSNPNAHHFAIKKEKWKIMISAPHSVNHIREWELLKADLLTWWLSLYLSERFNIPCIYSISNLVWDPNYDDIENCEYKQRLLEYVKENNIKFLIDLHWCWSERNFAIELWTWWDWHPNLQGNEKLLNVILNSLKDNLSSYLLHTWREITVNTIFPASHKNTISNFIFTKAHIPTLQLEINYELRDTLNVDKITKLITALEKLIEDINNYHTSFGY